MKKINKYPLLISMIISCVIIVASIFVLAFCGMRLGTSLAGGSQFEIIMTQNSNSSEYVSQIKSIVNKHGKYVDSAFVEDKAVAGENPGDFTRYCLVVNIAGTDISEETKNAIINDIASTLNIDKANISEILPVTNSVEAKSVLFVGIAIAIIAVALFVFAWIRYEVFAGIAFVIAFLHNIILYLSLLILTRVELGLMSLSVALVLTVLMSAVLIHIFEKYREETKLHLAEKMSVSERMIYSETQVVKPYLFIVAAMAILILMLLFVPVSSVKLVAVNILIALIVSAYTALIIGPAVNASLLEIRDLRQRAVLSRNDEINKEIKKKVKKSSSKSDDDKPKTKPAKKLEKASK